MADIFHHFPIKAPRGQVFRAVSSPAGLDTWWTKGSSGEPVPCQSYGHLSVPRVKRSRLDSRPDNLTKDWRWSFAEQNSRRVQRTRLDIASRAADPLDESIDEFPESFAEFFVRKVPVGVELFVCAGQHHGAATGVQRHT